MSDLKTLHHYSNFMLLLEKSGLILPPNKFCLADFHSKFYFEELKFANRIFAEKLLLLNIKEHPITQENAYLKDTSISYDTLNLKMIAVKAKGEDSNRLYELKLLVDDYLIRRTSIQYKMDELDFSSFPFINNILSSIRNQTSFDFTPSESDIELFDNIDIQNQGLNIILKCPVQPIFNIAFECLIIKLEFDSRLNWRKGVIEIVHKNFILKGEILRTRDSFRLKELRAIVPHIPTFNDFFFKQDKIRLPDFLANISLENTEVAYSSRWQQITFQTHVRLDLKLFPDMLSLTSVGLVINKSLSDWNGLLSLTGLIGEEEFSVQVTKDTFVGLSQGELILSNHRQVRDLLVNGTHRRYRLMPQAVSFRLGDKAGYTSLNKIINIVNQALGVSVYDIISEEVTSKIEIRQFTVGFRNFKSDLLCFEIGCSMDWNLAGLKIANPSFFFYRDGDLRVIQALISIGNVQLFAEYDTERGFVFHGHILQDTNIKIDSLINTSFIPKELSGCCLTEGITIYYQPKRLLAFEISVSNTNFNFLANKTANLSISNVRVRIEVDLSQKDYTYSFFVSVELQLFKHLRLHLSGFYAKETSFEFEGKLTRNFSLNQLLAEVDGNTVLETDTEIFVPCEEAKVKFSTKKQELTISGSSNDGEISISLSKDASNRRTNFKVVCLPSNKDGTFILNLAKEVIRAFNIESLSLENHHTTDSRAKRGYTLRAEIDLNKNDFTKLVLSGLEKLGYKGSSKLSVIFRKDPNTGKLCMMIDRLKISLQTEIARVFRLTTEEIMFSPRGFTFRFRFEICKLGTGVNGEGSMVNGKIALNINADFSEPGLQIFRGMYLRRIGYRGRLLPNVEVLACGFDLKLKGYEDELRANISYDCFMIEFPLKMGFSLSKIVSFITDIQDNGLIEQLNFFELEPLSDNEPMAMTMDLSDGFLFKAGIRLFCFKGAINVEAFKFTGIKADIKFEELRLMEDQVIISDYEGVSKVGPEMKLRLAIFPPHFSAFMTANVYLFGLSQKVKLELGRKGLTFKMELGMSLNKLLNVKNKLECSITMKRGLFFRYEFGFLLDLHSPSMKIKNIQIPQISVIGAHANCWIELNSLKRKFQGSVSFKIHLFNCFEREVNFEFSITPCKLRDLYRKLSDYIRARFKEFVMSDLVRDFKDMISKKVEGFFRFFWNIFVFYKENLVKCLLDSPEWHAKKSSNGKPLSAKESATKIEEQARWKLAEFKPDKELNEKSLESLKQAFYLFIINDDAIPNSQKDLDQQRCLSISGLLDIANQKLEDEPHRGLCYLQYLKYIVLADMDLRDCPNDLKCKIEDCLKSMSS